MNESTISLRDFIKTHKGLYFVQDNYIHIPQNILAPITTIIIPENLPSINGVSIIGVVFSHIDHDIDITFANTPSKPTTCFITILETAPDITINIHKSRSDIFIKEQSAHHFNLHFTSDNQDLQPRDSDNIIIDNVTLHSAVKEKQIISAQNSDIFISNNNAPYFTDYMFHLINCQVNVQAVHITNVKICFYRLKKETQLPYESAIETIITADITDVLSESKDIPPLFELIATDRFHGASPSTSTGVNIVATNLKRYTTNVVGTKISLSKPSDNTSPLLKRAGLITK